MSEIGSKPDKFDFYIKLMDVCLSNSEELLRNAITLRKNSSFGPAYSLAVLGFEELSKYWFTFGLFIGIYQESDEEVSLLQTNHIYKQHLGWQTLSNYILAEWLEQTIYKSEFEELWTKLSTKELSAKAYQRKFNELLKIDSESSNLAKAVLDLDDIIRKLKNDPKIMDSRRNQGFYVEFDLTKREITSTPDSFIYEHTIFIDTFDFFLNFSKDYFLELKGNLKRRKVQETISNFRKAFDLIRSILEKHETGSTDIL